MMHPSDVVCLVSKSNKINLTKSKINWMEINVCLPKQNDTVNIPYVVYIGFALHMCDAVKTIKFVSLLYYLKMATDNFGLVHRAQLKRLRLRPIAFAIEWKRLVLIIIRIRTKNNNLFCWKEKNTHTFCTVTQTSHLCMENYENTPFWLNVIYRRL